MSGGISNLASYVNYKTRLTLSGIKVTVFLFKNLKKYIYIHRYDYDHDFGLLSANIFKFSCCEMR